MAMSAWPWFRRTAPSMDAPVYDWQNCALGWAGGASPVSARRAACARARAGGRRRAAHLVQPVKHGAVGELAHVELGHVRGQPARGLALARHAARSRVGRDAAPADKEERGTKRGEARSEGVAPGREAGNVPAASCGAALRRCSPLPPRTKSRRSRRRGSAPAPRPWPRAACKSPAGGTARTRGSGGASACGRVRGRGGMAAAAAGGSTAAAHERPREDI